MQKIELNIEGISHDDTLRVHHILRALIQTGGLFGVKGGQTILHFDDNGKFRGVQLNYWPWRDRT